MLIICRRPGERIIIGDDIVITVLPNFYKGEPSCQSKIGIDAPSNISVHREEIYKAIQRENREMEDED